MIFNLAQIEACVGIPYKGIIHVGGYTGTEVETYRKLGLKNTIFFEPQRNFFEIIKAKLLPNESVFRYGLSDEICELELNLSYTEGGIVNGSGASSSFLKPKIHLTEHPEVKFRGTEKAAITTLDNFIENNKVTMGSYNFINIDVQGYELKVLKGAANNLKYIDYILAEVNRDEVYEGCPLIEEIDEFLYGYKFERSFVNWVSKSWGDAIYIRN